MSNSAGHDGFGFNTCLYLLFFVACLIAYQPALDGSFISDDEHYVLNNAFVHDVSFDNLAAILDPTGTPAKLVENYAPVHLLAYVLEWQVFERNTIGYHVVNIALHAFASLLLLISFRRCGIARIPALLGSGFFLLHPANVEAVAWISQLKTPAALILSLLALLTQRNRPAVAAVLFALALFAKPTAAVALFALAAAVWQAGRNSEGMPAHEGRAREWGWVGVWGLVLVIFALAEFWAFNQTAGQAPVLYADWVVRLRTVCAIALRYLVMSLTSSGLSVFHEPPPADSWFDPWWLASLAVLGLLSWRMWHVWIRGRSEAIGWIWAVVSFAPISGVIPLPFPMADRYLYFIMPGQIGAVLLVGREHVDSLLERLASRFETRVVRNVLIGLMVGVIAVFAVRVHQRAAIWQTGFSMMADAEKNYPQGMAAQTRIARRLALTGDAEGAVRALRAARARGYNRLDHLLSERGYDRIRSSAVFDALVNELAIEWIERYEKIDRPDQYEYRVMAQAYVALDDLDTAIRRIEAGIEVKGPITEGLKEDLVGLQRIKRIRESKLPD
jgi:tetratricopeptide (TPR) repeat protein